MLRVLVIKPSSLGDIIHSAGAVDWLARSSDVEVSWIVNDEYVSFVKEFPGVHAALPFPRRRFRLRKFPFWLPEAAAWFRQLRGFDIAIDLQGLQRSALMARLSGARERFGPRGAREMGRIHYNRAVDVPDDQVHAIDRVLFLMRRVLETSSQLRTTPELLSHDARSFRLPVPDAAIEGSKKLVDDDALLALCPGTRWQSKMWPNARWAELIRDLRSALENHRLVLLGAPGERELLDDILSESGLENDGRVVNLAGRTSLWETAAFLERADCAITMDSAPLHLAAAVGTRTVSLFGPTDPLRVAPSGPDHAVLRRDELDCLTCYERHCPLPQRICLPDLRVRRVLEEVEQKVDR